MQAIKCGTFRLETRMVPRIPCGTQKPPVLVALWVVALPELQEVLVRDVHDMEAVGHDQRIEEVTAGNGAVSLGQIHHSDARLLAAGQAFEVATQARLRAPWHDIKHLVVLQIDQRGGIAFFVGKEVLVDIQHLGEGPAREYQSDSHHIVAISNQVFDQFAEFQVAPGDSNVKLHQTSGLVRCFMSGACAVITHLRAYNKYNVSLS